MTEPINSARPVDEHDDPVLFRGLHILEIFAEASRCRVPAKAHLRIPIRGVDPRKEPLCQV